MLAFICSMSDMPDRVTTTLGRLWRNRKAQAGMLSSGRICFKGAASASLSRARRPPRSGSITHTGMPRCASSSAFPLLFWNSQSM